MGREREEREGTYLNAQVGVHQNLAVKGRRSVIVGGDDAGGQALAGEGDAVNQVELEGPGSGGLGVEPRGGRAQAEVELDADGGLGRRLAQELPPRRAREPVLRQVLGLRVVRGRAKDLVFL